MEEVVTWTSCAYKKLTIVGMMFHMMQCARREDIMATARDRDGYSFEGS